MGKQAWQCSTPGCGRARYQEGLCDACWRRARKSPPRAAGTIRAAVYRTGATRRCDGCDQVEYTDGRQTWWTNARRAAA